MTLITTIAVLALAPFVAIIAGSIQRRTTGVLRGAAEFVAVIALWQTFNASMLGLWGASAGQYVQLGGLAEVLRIIFLLAQPAVPFFCYFQIVRPARESQLSDPTAF